MKPFAETCPADAFLNPELFRTPSDNPVYGEEQFREGKATADAWEVVSIGISGVWGASREGSSLTSYERIGYHANTADLLRGFLAGSARVVVYRWSADGWDRVEIKAAGRP
jgi:hypothetical protein